MADLEPEFEVFEHILMRAWMHRDASDVKALVQGDALFMFGTAPPVLLDRASFLGNFDDRFRLLGFRFHETTARRHGKSVWFSGHVELEMKLGPQTWEGKFLLTDLWRRGTVRRRWKLAERSLAPVKDDRALSDAIRTLQLWR
ncbi:DUF4440 domain-containing protein [Qipengyuania nanhaisediminis]|uniref:DUF4440 domain-containing protein n=1 Tax=Qipengyuania nanhaisediminis TaxID=604088 RepID=UPI0038B277A3